MDEQRYRFGVGVLVVASVVVGVILIMFFGAAPNFLARRYKITVNFPAAPVWAQIHRCAKTVLISGE